MKSPYNDYEVYGNDLYTKKVEQFDAKDDNLTLVQQYIYLTNWVSKDLDAEALVEYPQDIRVDESAGV